MFAFDNDRDYYAWKNGPEEPEGEDPENTLPAAEAVETDNPAAEEGCPF